MKIIRITFVLALLASISFSGMAQGLLKKAKAAITGTSSTSLSADEIAKGLKEALSSGASKGSDQASKLDGFFGNTKLKIPFPPDIKNVEQKLRSIGLGAKVDEFILSLNRAAEDAAKEAKPILVNAITGMTVQDAYSILKGQNDAATVYLKGNTSSALTSAFSPIVKSSLDKVSATKYYKELITRYNKIPMVKKVNPNLDEYATQKAIDGLFILVAEEEANIRANPLARTSDLLKKVFNQS